MAKTCHMCTAASMMLECALGWPCSGACECHTERETPLLVDELARLLKSSRAFGSINKSDLEKEHYARVREVLARYQKEVGDA